MAKIRTSARSAGFMAERVVGESLAVDDWEHAVYLGYAAAIGLMVSIPAARVRWVCRQEVERAGGGLERAQRPAWYHSESAPRRGKAAAVVAVPSPGAAENASRWPWRRLQ